MSNTKNSDATLLHKAFSADVSVGDGERAVMAKISTTAVDRDAEVLISQGCNSKDFERNPVVMWDHVYTGRLPVGKVVSFKRGENDITAKIVFASRPENHPNESEWLPDTLLSLYQQGVMKGFSVGLSPIETRPANERDIQKFGEGVRRVISKWSIIELSCCAIPANQEAVAIAVSKGVLSADTATKMFDYEAKTDMADDENGMVECSMCHKKFPPDDTTQTDDGIICKACMSEQDKPKSEPPAKHVRTEVALSPEPELVAKVVVHSIEGKAEAEQYIRVHHVVTRDTAVQINVKKLVVAEISKRRGRIYGN